MGHNLEKEAKIRKERMEKDPAFRQKQREMTRLAQSRFRKLNPELHAQKMRDYRARLSEKGTGAGIPKIYFFRAGDFVKIGFTKKGLESRLAQLQPGNPTPIESMGWFPADQSQESLIHDKFKTCRMTGEWFRLTPDLLDFISTTTAS